MKRNRRLQVSNRQLSGCRLQPLIDNPHVVPPNSVRRHVAIVIAAHNHFPAHYDFIDRSKKSAEVRMSETGEVQRQVNEIDQPTSEIAYSAHTPFGVDDIEPSLLCTNSRQIVFSVWVTLSEHNWGHSS